MATGYRQERAHAHETSILCKMDGHGPLGWEPRVNHPIPGTFLCNVLCINSILLHFIAGPKQRNINIYMFPDKW